MRIKDIKEARTIKANKDISVLGLSKEDILTATREFPNNNVFIFTEDSFGDGYSSTREVVLSSGVVEEHAEDFTLIDKFVDSSKIKQFDNIETEDLLDIVEVLAEVIDQRFKDAKKEIRKENIGRSEESISTERGCESSDKMFRGFCKAGDDKSIGGESKDCENGNIPNEQKSETRRFVYRAKRVR